MVQFGPVLDLRTRPQIKSFATDAHSPLTRPGAAARYDLEYAPDYRPEIGLIPPGPRYATGSMSGSLQVLSNHGSSGP